MNFQNKYSANLSLLFKAASLLLLWIVPTFCYDFNRSTTGVGLSVYVHHSTQGAASTDWESYSLNDVKTMMTVISTRFSKILTFGQGARTDNHNFSQIYAGEAAALINSEMQRNGKTTPPLQVYLGVWLAPNLAEKEKEVSFAMESVNKANSIFASTVKGIVFGGENLAEHVDALKFVLDELDRLKGLRSSFAPDLKLGTRQKCEGFDPVNANNNAVLTELRTNIVKETDFIICEITPHTQDGKLAVGKVANQFNRQKEILKNISSQIEVMGLTEWPGRATNITEVSAMQDYWQAVDKWASETSTNVWMNEAIDNPWKTSRNSGHLGWWKLKDDSKTGMLEGYLEKATLLTKQKKAVKANGAGQKFVLSTFVLAFVGVFVNIYSQFVSKLI